MNIQRVVVRQEAVTPVCGAGQAPMSSNAVYLGIGSNIDPELYIRKGLRALYDIFGNFLTSSTYKSAAVGFSGPCFLNMVVKIETHLDLPDLVNTLKDIEYCFGRERRSCKYSSRTLDIDILTYGDFTGDFCGVVLPREEILYNAHVLGPFAELAPDLTLPNQRLTLNQLWQMYCHPFQRIVKVNPAWNSISDIE